MANLKISILDEFKLVQAYVKDEIDKDFYYSASEKVMRKANKLKYNVLWDLTKSILMTPLVSIYFAPREIEVLKKSASNVNKIAAIVKQSDFNDWKAVETFYVNTGLQAKIFISEDEAIKWISKDIK
jgi:hypothetical protein